MLVNNLALHKLGMGMLVKHQSRDHRQHCCETSLLQIGCVSYQQNHRCLLGAVSFLCYVGVMLVITLKTEMQFYFHTK